MNCFIGLVLQITKRVLNGEPNINYEILYSAVSVQLTADLFTYLGEISTRHEIKVSLQCACSNDLAIPTFVHLAAKQNIVSESLILDPRLLGNISHVSL